MTEGVHLSSPALGSGLLPLNKQLRRNTQLTKLIGTGGGNWADEVEETYGESSTPPSLDCRSQHLPSLPTFYSVW